MTDNHSNPLSNVPIIAKGLDPYSNFSTSNAYLDIFEYYDSNTTTTFLENSSVKSCFIFYFLILFREQYQMSLESQYLTIWQRMI